ncbi:MAG: hypothetical protein ACERKD_06790 [Prolixibacteraceae bacterium]
MKNLIKHIVFFLLPIFLIVGLILLLPLNKEFAFHFIKGNCYNHGEWLYERIFENETPVDVAFIGSSRTLHAVNDKVLEELVLQKTGNKLNVANLGFCQQGRNFQYSVLKDLLKHKHPSLVVIEITEDEQRSSHQSFPYIADMIDVLTAPFLNAYYLSDLMKAINVRWEQLKFTLIFKTKLNSNQKSNYGYGSMDRVATPDEIQQNRAYWNRRILRDHSSDIGRYLDHYPFYFVQKSIELLKKNQVEFCFLFVPTSNPDIKESVFNRYYENLASCYSISPSNYQNGDLWLDASHFNNKGAQLVADELLGFLEDELCLSR